MIPLRFSDRDDETRRLGHDDRERDHRREEVSDGLLPALEMLAELAAMPSDRKLTEEER